MTCPDCGKPHYAPDVLVAIQTCRVERPRIGDLSMCFNCLSIMELTRSGLRPVPAFDLVLALKARRNDQ